MPATRATVRIVDKDRGFRALGERLRAAGERIVKVGIFGAAASADHGGLSNVDIGTIHEFGTDDIPQRSFIRATVDESRPQIQELQRKLGRGVVKGTITEDRGLGVIGAAVVGMIQKRIADRIPPPLQPETIARKGSSVPLIDTGQLRQSIAWEVATR
jgi:hypothetical protein